MQPNIPSHISSYTEVRDFPETTMLSIEALTTAPSLEHIHFKEQIAKLNGRSRFNGENARKFDWLLIKNVP